ncbi:hypothetical protein [Arthrobacter sp. MDT1-65]
MNEDELAAVIKVAIEDGSDVSWVNSDQAYWDEERGGLHTGVEGLINCTEIARKVLTAMKSEGGTA